MRKRPFLIFSVIAGSLLVAALIFIQSRRFADLVKHGVARYIPADLGVAGDFSEFELNFFPPGISVLNPRLQTGEKNLLSLPEGSRVTAKRLDLNFYPLQMLTGSIRIHEAVINEGEVLLKIDREKLAAAAAKRSRKRKGGLQWDQLFQVRAEAVALRNTRLDVEITDPKVTVGAQVENFRIGQSVGRGGLGYEISLDLRNVAGTYPAGWTVPARLDAVKAEAFVNALGVDLSGIQVAAEGLEVKLEGGVQGNVLDPKKLRFSTDTELKGSAEKVLQLLSIDLPVSGEFSYSGKVSADLQDIARTLALKGMFSGRDFAYRDWKFSEVDLEGRWESKDGGEVSVDRLRLVSGSRERSGGFQPASGGVVEADPFRFKPGLDEPLEATLRLKDAHIHWLAAIALKDVYPLDFRVTGPVTARFAPATASKAWEASVQLDFQIPRFRLDNQRLRQSKPYRGLLDIKDIRLQGGVRIDPAGIHPQGLLLGLPQTRFTVGGSIGFGTGYGLDIQGPVDLADVGTISEKEIRGRGELRTRVVGPSDRVQIQFEPQLKDASYLGLFLGDIRGGRIIWDDGPGDLLFERVLLGKGTTEYAGDGRLELGVEDERAHLDFRVSKGNISDFISIFRNLVKDFWWFPESLSGRLEGEISVRGGLDLAELEINAGISGQDWLFQGERFREVRFDGGYDRGRYFVENASVRKNKGRFAGGISFSEKAGLKWSLKTAGIELGDFDQFARMDVPLKGVLSLSSQGEGPIGSIDSLTQVSLNRLAVRGDSLAPSALTVHSQGGVLRVNGNALGGQGTVDLAYNFTDGKPSSVRAEFRRFDFSPVLLMLNPRLMHDRDLEGRISGAMDLTFRTGAADLSSGTLSLSEYVLAKSGTEFRLENPVSVRLDAGSFSLQGLGIGGEAAGHAKADVAGRKAALDGRITGKIDLSVLEFLTSTVQKAEGFADLEFALSGTLREPRLNGTVKVADSRVRIRSLESPFENVRGLLELRQNVITVRSIEADLANGTVDASGTVELFASKFPTLDLRANLVNNKLQVYPFQFVRVKGKLHAHGETLPYTVDGDIRIVSALSRESVLGGARKGAGLKVAKYTPPPVSTQDSDYPRFKLDILATADSGILVKNDLFDAELKTSMRVVNTIEAPRLLGTAEVVRGKMSFKDQDFQIQSARVEFDNPTVIDPKFNLNASADVKNVKVQLYASGRMSSWKIELSSNPVMSETEIISLLAIGLTAEQLGRMNSGDRTLLQQKDAASVLLHSLDFNRDVKEKTGLEIQLEEAVNTQVGTSITRKAGEVENVAAPKIVIKRQIGKNVDISVGSTVGAGTGSQQEVNAEVKVTPGVSVIGVWESFEGTDTQDNQTSYGVDLKVQKRFK